MKIKPLLSRRLPQYPTQEFFAHQPDVLARYIPARWLRSKAVLGTLMAFVTSGAKAGIAAGQELSLPALKAESNRAGKVDQSDNADVRIAPIFIHGDGTGATGCVVMSPPVFLTEEEAMQVVMDEFGKEKLAIDQINKPLPDLFFERESYEFPRKIKHPLVLNILSKKRNLGVVFIGAQNYDNYGGEGSMGTVQEYNMISLGQRVKEKLREYGKINAAVFYDPLISDDYDYRKPRAESGTLKAKAEDLLRDQVRDFLQWMKKELVAKAAE